ncbi:MAG: hypothetical protein ACUVUC_06645 [Thermoguttaceae bacterium]
MRTTRRADGTCVIENNRSCLGAVVNSEPIGPSVLQEGQLIRLRTNIIRFYRRRRGAGGTGQQKGRVWPVPGAESPTASTPQGWVCAPAST